MIDATTNLIPTEPARAAEPTTRPAAPDRAVTLAPLNLENYPAVRQISLTARDCDLVGRAMALVLGQCEKAAGDSPIDPVASLGALWLRDEIKRIGVKFAPVAA